MTYREILNEASKNAVELFKSWRLGIENGDDAYMDTIVNSAMFYNKLAEQMGFKCAADLPNEQFWALCEIHNGWKRHSAYKDGKRSLRWLVFPTHSLLRYTA